MRRLIVTTVHEMENDDCVEWALNGLFQGGITAEEIQALRRDGRFEIQDRVPQKGVTLRTTVILEPEDHKAAATVTMGVGRGDGALFVHGNYDSIKAAQAIVLERDALLDVVKKLMEALDVGCVMCECPEGRALLAAPSHVDTCPILIKHKAVQHAREVLEEIP